MARDFQIFAFDLDARLFANAVVAFARTVQRFFFARERMLHCGELRDLVDFPSYELIALLAADSGDEREVIVVAAAPVAFTEPSADVAVLARLGIAFDGVAVVGGFFEALFDVAVVGGIFSDAILLGCGFFARRDDPHEFGEIVGGGNLCGVEVECALGFVGFRF